MANGTSENLNIQVSSGDARISNITQPVLLQNAPIVPRDHDELTDIIFGYDRSFTHGFTEGYSKATNEESSHSEKLGRLHGQKIGLDVGVMEGVARALLTLEHPDSSYLSLSAEQTASNDSLSKLTTNCLLLVEMCNEIKQTGFMPEDTRLFDLLDKARKKYRLICAQSKISPNVGPSLHSPVGSSNANETF